MTRKTPTLIIITFFAQGCATLFSDAYQKIQFQSTPKGAIVKTTDKQCQTPCELLLNKIKDYEFSISHNEVTKQIQVNSNKYEDELFWWNLLFWPAFFVDIETESHKGFSRTFYHVDFTATRDGQQLQSSTSPPEFIQDLEKIPGSTQAERFSAHKVELISNFGFGISNLYFGNLDGEGLQTFAYGMEIGFRFQNLIPFLGHQISSYEKKYNQYYESDTRNTDKGDIDTQLKFSGRENLFGIKLAINPHYLQFRVLYYIVYGKTFKAELSTKNPIAPDGSRYTHTDIPEAHQNLQLKYKVHNWGGEALVYLSKHIFMGVRGIISIMRYNDGRVPADAEDTNFNKNNFNLKFNIGLGF
ncbi:MAG: hypothetical protein HYV97_10990 [Bdellovibrio sp.]|nr:hypothetical protein [Bdellovibrio sp.]